MKPFYLLGACTLLLLSCSAGGNDSEGTSSGAAGSSSTGNVGSGVGNQPNLGTSGSGGGVTLDPTGGTGGGTDPDVANGECAQQNFLLSSKPADVLLVLDRSASMIENQVPSGETRWAAVVPSLTAVIAETDASVSWGLKVFPEGEGEACVASSVTDAVPVPITPANASAVNAAITATMATGNGTPTGEAIKRATAYLQSRGASNQYILLATDGDPSCPDGDEVAEQYAYDAIEAASAAGFKTYVIGVLDPVKDKSKFAILNQMAELGGTSRSDNPVADKFYQAYSKEELTAAIKAVTGQVASCVFEFDKRPPDETNIAVKVNGVKIAQDATRAEGWEYTSDQYLGLELYGSACQQVKDATENKVDIIFGCRGVPIK